MSKAGRLGLVALAVVVAIVAFVVARPDDEGEGEAGTPAAQTTPTATAPSAPKPPADAKPPRAQTIELTDHVPTGGVEEIEVAKGEQVNLIVDSDQEDDIHVHGYDVERKVAAGKPARFSFKADIEGVFEIESHEAEHHGTDPVIAKLVVKPS